LFARNWSSYTSVKMAWFEIKERSLNLKFKPHNTYSTNQTMLGFHSSFQIT
jgi:hypothetical protein